MCPSVCRIGLEVTTSDSEVEHSESITGASFFFFNFKVWELFLSDLVEHSSVPESLKWNTVNFSCVIWKKLLAWGIRKKSK